MSMSEVDVQKQIEHMIAFIQQEAKERVQEIEAKAEEEFNIEKGRLVQQERMRLMNVYEKKVKQITMLQKIHESRCLNQCRLSKLKCQQDIISNLLDIIREKLALVAKDKENYKPILKQLILQAALQLMEPEVELFCVEEDLNMIKSLIISISEEYAKFGGGVIKFKVNETRFLPQHVFGGIELVSKNGEIRVDNTLSARLDLISNQKIPDIRKILFGENPRRKFTN